MNFDYNTFYHYPKHKSAFSCAIQSHPKIIEAYDQAQSLINNSIFKGKISIDLFIYKGKAWFTTTINNTYSCNNFVYAYSGLWVRLAREIEGMKVQIKNDVN